MKTKFTVSKVHSKVCYQEISPDRQTKQLGYAACLLLQNCLLDGQNLSPHPSLTSELVALGRQVNSNNRRRTEKKMAGCKGKGAKLSGKDVRESGRCACR